MRKGVIRQFSIRLFNTTRARAIGIKLRDEKVSKRKGGNMAKLRIYYVKTFFRGRYVS